MTFGILEINLENYYHQPPGMKGGSQYLIFPLLSIEYLQSEQEMIIKGCLATSCHGHEMFADFLTPPHLTLRYNAIYIIESKVMSYRLFP